MFKNHFVACLKVSDQILREDAETVRLPFGSEFSLLLKNLSGQRAVVSVSIDGQDVLEGRRLIVDANKSIDLERFIKDGNLTSGHRFRFIHKDEKIQAHRGDRVDDGIVRVSFQFEQPSAALTFPWITTTSYLANWDGSGYVYKSASDITLARHVGDTVSYSAQAGPAIQSTKAATPQAEEGITVAGSTSGQTFTMGSVGRLDPTVHVITLKLLGESPVTGQLIETPVTVREPLPCSTCGTANTSSHHFCYHCGTCLGD